MFSITSQLFPCSASLETISFQWGLTDNSTFMEHVYDYNFAHLSKRKYLWRVEGLGGKYFFTGPGK